MTPEEAKPHTDFDIEITYRSGKKQTKTVLSPTPFFTAKETAEIAISYAYDERRFQSSMSEQAEARYMAWRDKFEEWSK